MSHHFDTPTAREDPRLNICDFYLFDGAPADACDDDLGGVVADVHPGHHDRHRNKPRRA